MKRLALILLFALAASCAHASPANARPRNPMQRALDNTVALVTQTGRVFCSGFITEGYIVTAAHCVDGDTVTYVRNREGTTIKVLVAKVDFVQDVAALAPFSGKFGEGIPLGEALDYGDTVFVLGHSKGFLDYSLSRGIVAHPRRTVDGVFEGQVWMQHDAGSVGGNSGGPVMDERGRIVGLTSFGYLNKVVCGFGCDGMYSDGHISGAAHIESIVALLSSLR